MLASSRFCCSIALVALVLADRVAGQDPQDPLRALERYVMTHRGDAKRGRALFRREETTKCLICHKVGTEGGRAGPNLSAIAGKFDRPHLIESLLEPSKQIVEGYRTSVLALRDGRTVTGVIRERSDASLTLYDGAGKKLLVARADVEERIDSSVSLMPRGLEKQLSPDELTDLIAYLETLRPGGKPKFGSGIAGPVTLPPGLEVDVITTGLDGATALETLPDGRVLICEQTGSVRVVEHGQLLEKPFVTLPVDSNWERGVIGVTIDPDFPRQPFVYVCWVAQDPFPHHRVSRFLTAGNVAAGTGEVLLVGDDQTKMGGKVPNGHQGGALHFGPDDCLYVAIGEQTAGEPAQRLDSFLGKILRIHRNGSIPDDNPFFDEIEGKYRAIWAYGCRNPFTFAFRESDGLLLINDVGGKFEEINAGRAAANFGWPAVDHGPQDRRGPYVGPIHWYPQASIAGGDFHPESGDYYFADFVHGWIKIIDPEHPQEATTFATGLRRPVDLRFAADGGLYVLLRNAWVIDGKFEGGTGSLLRMAPRTAELSAP